MGLFDNIRFEPYVPGRGKNHTFQTKSLDNCMTTFVVSEKGEIYSENHEYKYVYDESHILGGYLEKVPDSYYRKYLRDFHGDIIFYDEDYDDEWVARFTNGRLHKVSFMARERLNDEEILYERIAIREQDPSQGNQ